MLVDKLVLCRQPEELVRAQAKVEALQAECEMVKEILNKMEEMENGRED
jgi:prefoldin subunit 5